MTGGRGRARGVGRSIAPSLGCIATHYDVLGVPPDASQEAIRVAYRERARAVHPDRGAGSTEAMAAINEAYRVLADPGRRALYDRSLRGTPVSVPSGTPSDPAPAVQHRPSRLAPDGPARIPWRLMAATALIGSAVVLVSSWFDDPPSEQPPDGILGPGSCVAFETNGDVREVACSDDGDGDIVVEVLVPLGGICPGGTVGHRDRLGLGLACVAT